MLIFECFMEKSTFLSVLPKLKEISLPGNDAHKSIAPPDRMQRIKERFSQHVTPKQAAVMICCYPKEDNSFYFPLIQRNVYPGVHSGQISLPGGKMDLEDTSLWHTAHRELKEELGIDVVHQQQICQLSSLYIPPSNFWVTPYLTVLDSTPTIIAEQREVAEVFELSLASLISLSKEEQTISNSYLNEKSVSGYTVNKQFVWGATAMILTELKMILSELITN